MRRRELIKSLSITTLALAGVVRPASAQAPLRHYRLAFVHPSLPAGRSREAPFWRVFFEELDRLGYREGQNLTVDYYSAEGHPERFAELARQVASSNPDVIAAPTAALVAALKAATNTIPIVAGTLDPVIAGLVPNVARPGGNLTGVAQPGIEIVGKQLQILKELVPSASRVVVLATVPDWPVSKQQELAARLEIRLIEVAFREATPSEIERGFAELMQQNPDALLVGPDATFGPHARLIVRLTEQNRLPAIYSLPGYYEVGGLLYYAFDPAELPQQLAQDVHRIFNGTKPGDIPIYQSARFKLVINLKAAKAIGLTIPESLINRADQVIE